jgi:hypothetical protein
MPLLNDDVLPYRRIGEFVDDKLKRVAGDHWIEMVELSPSGPTDDSVKV